MRAFNPLCEQLSGYAADEIVGQPYWEHLPPHDERDGLRALFGQLRPGSVPDELVTRWSARDGQIYIVRWHLRLELDATGAVTALVGIGYDITDPWATADALRRSEQKFRALIEKLPEAVLVSRDGMIIYANPAMMHLLGATSMDQLLNNAAMSYIEPAERPLVAARVASLKEELGRTVPYTERRIRRLDGTLIIAETSAMSLLYDDEPANLVLARDVTSRWRAEQALIASEKRYAMAVRSTNSGLWEWDREPNGLYLSPRFKQLLGFDEDELPEDRNALLARVHPEDRAAVFNAAAENLSGNSPRFEAEVRIRNKGGDYRWFLVSGMASFDESGAVDRVVGSVTDVNERRMAEQQVIREVHYDRLTDLPNRTLFLDRLTRAVERGHESKALSFAVLFLDLDRFKVLNDSLGHLFGDEVLGEVARRLQACVRLVDVVARFGGDEFTILLERISGEGDAIRVANRIHAQLEHPITVQGREVFTSASIGIAYARGQYQHPDEILRDADNAMYQAKSQGRAQHVVFDRKMHDRAVRRLHLETDLRRALDRQELMLLYQPIISLEHGGIVGFESLVRWRHPTRGVISPDEFIPAAEETGLILPLGLWVFQESCRQLRAWTDELPEAADLSIAVNLSGRQFQQPDLVEQFEKILKTERCPGRRVRLEVTESTVMGDTALASDILSRLRALNIHVCIDDFGTGYSSLSLLHRFPIDTLKIDRSFVAMMDRPPRGDDALVRSIVALGHQLGISVVAEGVERPAQLHGLRELGCEFAQGFLFHQPLTAGEASAVIAENPTW